MVAVAVTLISATLYFNLCLIVKAFVVNHFPIDQSILELSHDCSMRLGAYGQGKTGQLSNLNNLLWLWTLPFHVLFLIRFRGTMS